MLFSPNIAIINGCTEPKIKMPTPKKEKIVKKVPTVSQKKAPQTSTKPSKVMEKSKGVFEGLKEKFEPVKVDEFQKRWLALPENRKKYQKITDAPQVAAEELLAITNDLIDYLQGEETGKSGFIKGLKSTVGKFFKNPAKFVQEKVDQGKEAAIDLKNSAENKAKEIAKNAENKTKEMASDVQKVAQKKAKTTPSSVKPKKDPVKPKANKK